MSSDAIASFPFSKKTALIRLLDPDQFNKWDKIMTRLGATKNNSHDDPGWLLAKNKLDAFDEAVELHGSRQRRRSRTDGHNNSKRFDDDTSSEEKKGSRFRSKRRDKYQDETPIDKHSKEFFIGDNETIEKYSRTNSSRDSIESDESESSDDELIQTVLARKLQSESSHKSIDVEEIKDSDDEDCVSYARRLRHIYNIIRDQRERIRKLEEYIQDIKP